MGAGAFTEAEEVAGGGAASSAAETAGQASLFNRLKEGGAAVYAILAAVIGGIIGLIIFIFKYLQLLWEDTS